jgi:hypothetical protein
MYRNNHTHKQIYIIVYDKRKQNKFDNSRQYSSRQAKAKLKLWQAKAKLKLWRRIVAAGSPSSRGIDEVVSLLAALM